MPMITKEGSLVLATALAVLALGSAGSAAEDVSCSCRSAFDTFADRLDADYIAPHLDPRVREGQAGARALLSRRSDGTPIGRCHEVLQAYVASFRDGHLFVMEQPAPSEAEAKELARKARRFERDEASIQQYLERNRGRLDPIEGIWFATAGQRFGVFRDPAGTEKSFVGVVLSGAPEGWSVGQVKAEFRGLDDGSYDVTLYDRKHFPRHPHVYLRGQKGGAALRRGGDLLHMPPTTWGRAFPAGSGVPIDADDPRHPTVFYPDAETVVIAVPSHSPEHADRLAKLTEEAGPRIAAARTLIIDFRGNEGGSSGTTNVLAPFLLSPVKAGAVPTEAGDAGVLSSPDNIAYFARSESQGWVPKGLVARMGAAPGRVVTLLDAPASPEPLPSIGPGDVSKHPESVAILVDGAVVSAAEAALLQARPFSKVTVFGSPTGGTIDYQSVNVVDAARCGTYGFSLGYPIMAGSLRLPKGGYNAAGIPPDVTIRASEMDPIAFIVKYYTRPKP